MLQAPCVGSSRVAVPADVFASCLGSSSPSPTFALRGRKGGFVGFLPECLERFGGFCPSQLLLRGRQDALADLLVQGAEQSPS